MKKLKFIILVVIVFVLLTSSIAMGIHLPVGNFDETRIDSGSIGARYISSVNKRVKTRIQNSSDKYDYDLFGRESFEYFPLQMGNGNYKVLIFENVVNNRYRQVKSKNVKINLKDYLSVYLASIQTVNWNDDMVAIKKARELVGNLETEKDKIKAIYEHVVNTLSYDYEKINKINSTYVPDIEVVYKEGKGICYDYSALLAAMLRSLNIPTKLIKGYSDNVEGYHAWNEVYLSSEKRWIVIDATYDSVLAKHGRSYTMEKERERYRASREY